MKVLIRSHSRRIKKKIEIDLTWYDPKTKQLLKGRGGRIEFRYDPDQKRMWPWVVDEDSYYWEDSWEDIMDIVNKSGVTVEDTIPNRQMEIEVEDYMWPNLVRQLTDKSILYEIQEEDIDKTIRMTIKPEKWNNTPSKWEIKDGSLKSKGSGQPAKFGSWFNGSEEPS